MVLDKAQRQEAARKAAMSALQTMIKHNRRLFGVAISGPHELFHAIDEFDLDGSPSHWRDCHFADVLSPSLLKHLLKVEGGAAE